MSHKKEDSVQKPKSGIDRKSFIKNGGAGLAAMAAGGFLGLGKPQSAKAADHHQTNSPGMFEDKVVLITGATSGIGAAAAREFAKEGAKVFFCGRRENLGAEVQNEIREAGGQAIYMKADVREEEQVKAFVQACKDEWGRIDIAFNNAGIEGPRGDFDEVAMGGTMGYDDLIKTNVNGVMYSMRYQLPVMREQGEGVIVNVGSMLSHRGSSVWGAYAASKHAVIGMTRSAASANAGHGIRVLSLSPGGTRTELLRRFVGGSLDNAGANSPMGRIAEPEEVARVMMSMCLAQNLFLNGDDVKADGASSA
ncbi:MAG: SDR family oxidoreductase [Balneolia bacterium]|nr:SDR family oxidoreductase [Balneolia bacterium]